MTQNFNAYNYSARAYANALKRFYGGDWLNVPFDMRANAYRILAAENERLRRARVSEMDAARLTVGEFFATLHRMELWRSSRLLQREAWCKVRLDEEAHDVLLALRDSHAEIIFRNGPVLAWTTHERTDDYAYTVKITRHERPLSFALVLRLRRAGYIRATLDVGRFRTYAISGPGCGALHLVRQCGIA